MKILILLTFLLVILNKSVSCHEFPKAITLKLIYQLITGELLSSKNKDNGSKLKNATSSYMGEKKYNWNFRRSTTNAHINLFDKFQIISYWWIIICACYTKSMKLIIEITRKRNVSIPNSSFFELIVILNSIRCDRSNLQQGKRKRNVALAERTLGCYAVSVIWSRAKQTRRKLRNSSVLHEKVLMPWLSCCCAPLQLIS